VIVQVSSTSTSPSVSVRRSSSAWASLTFSPARLWRTTVTPGGGGGGGGGGGRGGVAVGPLVAPGAYFVKLTVGGKTLQTSVDVLEDAWMRPQ